MTLDKKYYIHSRAGQLANESLTRELTTAQEVGDIVAAVKSVPKCHLIVHFHGGLVPKAAGFAIAEKLLPVYTEGGHPVFFVWESGAWETIRNNITELADEPVFKELLRKVLQYTLDRLGATDGARSIAPRHANPRKVKETLEEFIRHPGRDTIPYKGFVPLAPKDTARSAADGVDAAEIQADIEGDQDLRAALATLPDIPVGQRSSLSPVGPMEPVHDTPFSRLVSENVSNDPNRRGLISMFKVASLLARVLTGVLRRYHKGRDHGLYATVVEELLRGLKVGGSALNEWGKALQWNRMKQDCEDAFAGDPELHAGTALLARLRDELNGGRDLNRITLVGHSTGGVYICAWIEAAATLLAPEVQFDIVLLAPAVSYARFDAMLSRHAQRIRTFRMFAMSDALERDDQVWGSDDNLAGGQDWRRFIYPSSLLYLVSGILESRQAADGTLTDEADMPLLGMQRFFLDEAVYDGADFPEVGEVRQWLRAKAGNMVWSPADNAGNGLNCHCNDHGAFDDEATTLESLRHIVVEGF
jgi:pimeloyl-ACP methyl ester carboxylesterase